VKRVDSQRKMLTCDPPNKKRSPLGFVFVKSVYESCVRVSINCHSAKAAYSFNCPHRLVQYAQWWKQYQANTSQPSSPHN
jgi:hypothetical protein